MSYSEADLETVVMNACAIERVGKKECTLMEGPKFNARSVGQAAWAEDQVGAGVGV